LNEHRHAAKESVTEFTIRAVSRHHLRRRVRRGERVLGLRVGLTVSTSIPIAVLTVAFFKLMRDRPGILLEANISQTIGSASSSLAAGTIFTIPALFLWGMAPPFWQVAILALLGGLLGIAAMVPLRRLLIVRSADELPYPEGTACAEVLRATTAKTGSGGRWIFIGLAVGALIKLASARSCFRPRSRCTCPSCRRRSSRSRSRPRCSRSATSSATSSRRSWCPAADPAIVLTPLIALFGAGLAAPLFPEATLTIGAMSAGQIWSRYVRYIGAGAVAAAGIVAVARALPTMWSSLSAVMKGCAARESGSRPARRRERIATCRRGSCSSCRAGRLRPGGVPDLSPEHDAAAAARRGDGVAILASRSSSCRRASSV
jgi:uncharacterized oligopeptide transporter (OPT) family protein